MLVNEDSSSVDNARWLEVREAGGRESNNFGTLGVGLRAGIEGIEEKDKGKWGM